MILYHGSNVEIKQPKIIQSKRLLDFGTGFYLTSEYDQAKKWAYAANKNWLRYISLNRTDKSAEDSNDIVIGPVANDQAIRTVNNYIKGYFNEDIAIQLLLPQKLKDQYAFKTDKALSLLKFKEVRTV